MKVMGVDLLKHNQEAYENICHMYNEGIQRVAVVQPTGSGKSMLMTKLIEDNPDSRFFVLSTSHKINDQFKSKLDEEALKRIDFNIYCNMPNMSEATMKALQADYILLDEMHRALAKEWNKGIKILLEMYPNAKVLGLSATPIRYLDRCRNVVNELFGGNLACDMSLSQAILDGILPMARYVCGVYSFEKDTESLNKKIAKSCNSDEEKKELLEQVKVLKQNWIKRMV
jgi:superfamily II DNA or RNA helicase